ncbi:MAG: M23 family metallopeptidase [Candidatus Paceibacterota bacterium]
MFPNLQIRKYSQKIKESSKDPICRLGAASVLLLLIVILFSGPVFKSLEKKGVYSLLSAITGSSVDNCSESSFLDPSKKPKSESPDLLLVQNCSLQAASPPVMFTPQILAALTEGYNPEDVNKVIIEYVVEKGDTFSTISERFNVSVNTILWANNLTSKSSLKNGQKLIIPPVDGVVHYVKSGDTLSSIASKYKGKVEEILAFNDLSSEGDIYLGDVIIIPNGVITPKTAKPTAPVLAPLASGAFICPISSPCRVTQWLHYYNAVDFSHGQCGESIFAAAAGTVLKVKLTSSTSRWAFGGAGNTISILHSNGVVTSYGHVKQSLVNPGDQVTKGQIIASMGGSPGTPGAGNSTGCHLHFGVSGARNPFSP